MVDSVMEESKEAATPPHVFRIYFNFRDRLQTGCLTMSQKTDHDEYHIMPDDIDLAKEFGSQTIDFYFNQPDSLRSAHPKNDYLNSILTGVREFLDSKHN